VHEGAPGKGLTVSGHAGGKRLLNPVIKVEVLFVDETVFLNQGQLRPARLLLASSAGPSGGAAHEGGATLASGRRAVPA